MTFSIEIFGAKAPEVIDKDDSCRKLIRKNSYYNNSKISIKGDKYKTKQYELEDLNENNKNIDSFEDLTEEIIDKLDIGNLRKKLKEKIRKSIYRTNIFRIYYRQKKKKILN